MGFSIYGKENCKFCEAAKNLLDAKGEKYIYNQVGVDTTKEELVEYCQKFGVIPRTVPQIFCDSGFPNQVEYVGGFEELKAFIA